MADKEIKKKLEGVGKEIVEQVERQKNPSYELPIRTLNNVFFDEKSKTIKLGDKMSSRQFLNVAHSRKFMQTVLVAAALKKTIDEQATVSIRDLFYNMKHTIEGTEENTFDTQNESITPDEIVLVRMHGKLQLTTAAEAVNFAEKNGEIVVDEPERKIIAIDGLNVCGFNEQQKIREFKSDHIIVHPPNEAVKIVTSSGRSVKVTKSHSIFTINDGKPTEVKAKELKAGDYVALPRKIEIVENTEPINLIYSMIENMPQEELKKTYIKSDKATISEIISRIGKKKLKETIKIAGFKNSWSDVVANWKHWNTIRLDIIKETNPKIDDLVEKILISSRGCKHYYKALIQKSEELGIIIGALLSEGCFSKLKRRGKEMRISISNKSKEFLEEFKTAFEKTFGECSSKKMCRSKDGTLKINVGYDLLAKIFEYGLGVKFEKSWNKEVPPILLDAPKKCIQSFLYAFRKGDGSRGARFEIRFHTTSKKLVNGLVFFLLRQGLFANIYEYKRSAPKHDAFEVRVGNRDYSKELAKITLDYDLTFKKNTAKSSDKIPKIGNLVEKARKTMMPLNEQIHKEINFNQISKQKAISRPMLSKIISKLGTTTNEFTQQLQQILESDIYWDKIKSIEPAEVPKYTMDFSVKPVQNFIGGQGLMLLHNSDPVIEDLEAALNLLREELHLIATPKGLVAGNIKIKEAGQSVIDISKMGSSGWAVPSNVEPEKIDIKEVDADYVLFIEKYAVWNRFNEDKFWKSGKCLLLTGKGQPARAERRFAQRLAKEHGMKIYALTDADPWGYYIYSVIKQGSISLSYSEEKLANPDTKFIGLTTQDAVKFKLSKDVQIKLNKGDLKRISEMKGYSWFKKKEWQKEFQHMKEKNFKMELEALSSKSIRFITEKYLPQKIKSQDFLP